VRFPRPTLPTPQDPSDVRLPAGPELTPRRSRADAAVVGVASATTQPAIRRGLDPVVMAMLVVPSLVTTPAIVAGAVVAGATEDGAAAAWVIAVTGVVLSVAGTAWAARRGRDPRLASQARAGGHMALLAGCGVLCALGVLFATLSALVFDPVHLAWLAAAVTIPSAVMIAGTIVDRTGLYLLGLVVVNVVWAVDLALLVLEALRRIIVGS
jgi:hypothetical protein